MARVRATERCPRIRTGPSRVGVGSAARYGGPISAPSDRVTSVCTRHPSQRGPTRRSWPATRNASSAEPRAPTGSEAVGRGDLSWEAGNPLRQRISEVPGVPMQRGWRVRGTRHPSSLAELGFAHRFRRGGAAKGPPGRLKNSSDSTDSNHVPSGSSWREVARTGPSPATNQVVSVPFSPSTPPARN